MKSFRSWMVIVLVAVMLVLFATPAFAAELKGKIKRIDADNNRLIVTDNNAKDFTFEMNAQSKVRVADKDSKLADLKVADEVTVTYEAQGGKNIVTSIEKK